MEGIRTRIIEGQVFSRRGMLSAEESNTLEQSAAPPQLVYSISDAEVERAKVVHEAHADELMKMAGVQGVGITSSVDSPGEAALRKASSAVLKAIRPLLSQTGHAAPRASP